MLKNLKQKKGMVVLKDDDLNMDMLDRLSNMETQNIFFYTTKGDKLTLSNFIKTSEFGGQGRKTSSSGSERQEIGLINTINDFISNGVII